MAVPDPLSEPRARLEKYFISMAEAAGVEIAPTKRNARDALLVGRLYEETKGDRQFFVYPAEGLPLDAFTKQTGLHLEITLLVIYAELTESNLQALWRAYRAWMHGLEPEAAVLDLLRAR